MIKRTIAIGIILFWSSTVILAQNSETRDLPLFSSISVGEGIDVHLTKNVSKKLDARASSAGSVRYKGNPDKIYEDESSGGSVRGSN